jgi:hypothetical protein
MPLRESATAFLRWRCKETHVSLHPLKTSQGIGKNGWNGQTSTREAYWAYVEGGFCPVAKKRFFGKTQFLEFFLP